MMDRGAEEGREGGKAGGREGRREAAQFKPPLFPRAVRNPPWRDSDFKPALLYIPLDTAARSIWL